MFFDLTICLHNRLTSLDGPLNDVFIYRNILNNFENKTSWAHILGNFRIFTYLVLNLPADTVYVLRWGCVHRNFVEICNFSVALPTPGLRSSKQHLCFFGTDNQPSVGLRSSKHHLFVGTDNPWIAFIETSSLFP